MCEVDFHFRQGLRHYILGPIALAGFLLAAPALGQAPAPSPPAAVSPPTTPVQAPPSAPGAVETEASPAFLPPEPASAPVAQVSAPDGAAPLAPPSAGGPSIALAASDAAASTLATPAQHEGPVTSESAAHDDHVRDTAAGGTHIGGYAELHYSIEHLTRPVERQATIDLHRMVVFLGHSFTDQIRFYSEIEVEHALVAPDGEGELEIEQAYLDYKLLDDALVLRVGVLLVPMGIINVRHEPSSFHGVERPAVDTVIIPSTWREGGLGIFGEPTEGVRYEWYVVGGLDPTGFSAAQSIREGHQEVSQASANGLAVTGRVEIEPSLGLVAGLSGYFGLAGPNAALYDFAGERHHPDVPVWGIAADARGHYRGLEARGEAALFGIGDTAQLRQAANAAGESLGLDIGAQSWGAYAEVAYDVLHEAHMQQALLPFIRVERYDTMASVRGRPETPDDERYGVTSLALGLTHRPIAPIAFKTDFVFENPDGPSRTRARFDLGFGLMF